MGKRLVLILACALLVGLVALPAFAEVQNIKVSGDITALGISRSHFEADVNKADQEESHAASIIRLRVDADLTEKVGVTVRLLNERDWDQDVASNEDISIDLGYISLKEFFYPSLTLLIGRQELHFGNDLIIGDPDTNNQVAGASIVDADLSAKKAFDAIRGTLNYDPLVIDIIWAKVDENTLVGTNAAPENDDIDLFGVNARYDFGGKWKTIGELYWFGKVDGSFTSGGVHPGGQEKINNIGSRLEITPLERLMLQGEVAYQFGRNAVTLPAALGGDTTLKNHSAWATQGVIRYALNTKYNPVLMGIYSFFSGDDDAGDKFSKAWDPMFENQTIGHIANAIADNSDLHVFNIRGSLIPIDDLTVTLDYVWVSFAQKRGTGATLTTRAPGGNAAIHTLTGDHHLGDEVDLKLTYDYTEDVQLGLLAGWFIPGNAFNTGDVANINEVIASCKVSF